MNNNITESGWFAAFGESADLIGGIVMIGISVVSGVVFIIALFQLLKRFAELTGADAAKRAEIKTAITWIAIAMIATLLVAVLPTTLWALFGKYATEAPTTEALQAFLSYIKTY